MNIRKSKAMAAGSWDTSMNMMCSPFQECHLVEGDKEGQNPGARCVQSEPMFKTTNQHVYLCTLQVQIFPAPKKHERQLSTAISWYIWRGAIFRVPLSTFQCQTLDRGMDLIDVAAKCRALFPTRFWAQGDRDGSLTAEWLNVWALLSPRTNPHT